MRTRPVLPSGPLALWLAVLLLITPAALPTSAQAQAAVPPSQQEIKPPAPDAPPIRLQAGTFIPAAGEALQIPTDLIATGSAPNSYYIVQFSGPVQEAWKEQVAKAGGAFFDYVPDFAFIVRLDDAARAAVTTLSEVAWVGAYLPAYKLSPDLAGRTGMLDLVVQTFPDATVTDLSRQMDAAGALIEETSASAAGGVMRLQIEAAQLKSLAEIPAVRWIEPFYERVLFNDVARGNAIMGAETAWTDLGLYGQGQIVAVADTGLDTGSLTTLHQDFLGTPTGCTGTDRIIATYALGRTGNWSDSCRTGGVNDGGHGTHVSGSVLGNGCRSASSGRPGYTGSYAGLAPQAGLVMQSVMDSSCGLGGLPTDLNTLFAQARTAGARIHTNSWGAPEAGKYTTDARNTDLFTWNNQDATILFSAGNEGTDANSDGFIDLDSIGAPGTAKNIITVGASENNRTTGGYNPGGACSTWGTCWPTDYPAEPIKSDPLSNNPGGMVAFSSRGPTDDGRIKPDVVAPGSNILSTKSQATNVSVGWGAGPNQYYQYMGGTSMATPLTAGAVALIRQFYTDVKSVTPSGALLKATVINSATDLYPGQYVNPLEHNPRLPNFAQGWGRVNVANAISSSRQFHDIADTDGVSTGASQSYPYGVCTATTLKISLVWTDYPGATLAARELVNDLDLVVTAPDGTIYLGNAFSGGWSAAGGSADRVNNVEGAYFQSPAAGDWIITVHGYNVPNGVSGKQGYALVVDRPGDTGSCFAMQATPPVVNLCAPNDAVYDVSLSAIGGFTDPVALGATGAPTGTSVSFSSNPTTPPGSSTLTVGNTAGAAAGTYAVILNGTAGALTRQADLTLNMASTLPGAAAALAPSDGSTGQSRTPTLTWTAVPGSGSYDIQVATDPAFTAIVAAATGLTGTSFTPGAALADNTVYYWRVQATNGCGTGSYAPIFAFATSGSATASFCRSPGLAIPDNNPTGVADNQTVVTAGRLLDLNVSVRATHTWMGDLIFTVQNVGAGTNATLIDRPGYSGSGAGCDQNHINATLDDGAAAPVESQCASSATASPPPYAIAGTFTPNNALSVFNNQQLAGTWRLTASDRASIDTGTLTQWCLIATYGVDVVADYSNLSASYGVAWHTGNGALRLGTAWDADLSFDTDADDIGDDAGVTFVGAFAAGKAATVQVDVQGTPAAGRWLRVWFDWDNDGGFDTDELIYDGVAAAGANELAVNVPADVTAAVKYRVRLYDSAAAPSVAALGGAAGGEVEDGSAPCAVPASVTSATLTDLGGNQLQLDWVPAAGANRYEVWWSTNAPYFVPGIDCANPGSRNCATEPGASFSHTASTGNPTYVILAVSGCGERSPNPPRLGRFSFELISDN